MFRCIYRCQRPPGVLRSSMLGLEAMTGSLDDFGFEDYLNGNCPIASFYNLIANQTHRPNIWVLF